MSDRATVLKKLDNNLYEIEVKRSESCVGCSGCGLGGKNAPDELILHLESSRPLQIGSEINVKMKSGTILNAAFRLYLLPLLFFIMGTLLTQLVLNERLAVLVGMVFMLFGIYLAGKSDNSKETVCEEVIDNS